MARGDKNYSEVTHKASKEGTKAKQKAVWDMIGAKKKLHEMVEALIGGDSKAAASALHEYLQQKTRAILGESDEELDLDLDSDGDLEIGDEVSDAGDEFGDEPECETCHGEGCEECASDDLDDDLGDDLGGDEFGDEPVVEGNETKATPTFKGAHNNAAKDLNRKTKGKIQFATKGKAKLTKPHNNAAPGLDRKVKGDVKFASNGKAKLTKPHNNAAPGLDRKVKGKVDFGK